MFNQWLPFSSSVFASSTLRVYSSFNAGVFGRIEQSAVYAGTSFFISPTLFLQSIHYNHPDLKRVYIVRLFTGELLGISWSFIISGSVFGSAVGESKLSDAFRTNLEFIGLRYQGFTV